ncbi:5'-AMP-activated protein kinase beta-2 subunit protein [Actinidia rufa]|uniref:5'-AMP-activated protein kinase beta-2 subunit protein n=1 Tax=Actinidia rufa TaxID=165716 RepID=A0A7J0HBX5_9ERIC|nr:5'-AMP-activated protein kinase beta-2 subunit protein [Actinidia rufa]
MGNANGRQDAADGGGPDDVSGRSNGDLSFRGNHAPSTHPPSGRVASSDSMGNSPPDSPGRSGSPLMFAPQAAKATLQMTAVVAKSRKNFNSPHVKEGGFGSDSCPYALQDLPPWPIAFSRIMDCPKISNLGEVAIYPLRLNCLVMDSKQTPDMLSLGCFVPVFYLLNCQCTFILRSAHLFPSNFSFLTLVKMQGSHSAPVPVAPLRRNEGAPFVNQMWQNEPPVAGDLPAEQGIPTLITWNHGGNDVAVEGSWDSWTSRKMLQRSGKDHSILLVLPSGIYHYKFIVDGVQRYIPDLPFVADETGHVCNLLDVHDYVPENFESVEEFKAPPSPDSSYSHGFLREEDFAKEPVEVPSQLHLTVVGMQNTCVPPSSSRPQHVVLNHLFIEKGRASQSVVALGLTHRFHSKYVTVVLYKPLKR